MENTLSVSLMLAFLLIGVVGGVVLTAGEVETITLPGEIVYETVYETTEVPVNVTVEVPVADISPYLDQAVEDFMDYVDDEELFVCGDYEYNFDEISESRVYDSYSVSVDDEDAIVNFRIKLEFDEDDERSCKKTFEVEAYYEEDEDVEITVD